MTLRLPFSTDIEAGIQNLYHEDADGNTTVETFQDVECVIEDAKYKNSMFDERSPWKGDLHQVAEIPMTIIMDIQRQGIIDDPKRFRKWLNDRDNKVFRTRPGRV